MEEHKGAKVVSLQLFKALVDRIVELGAKQEMQHAVETLPKWDTHQTKALALAFGSFIKARKRLHLFLAVDGTLCLSRFELLLRIAVGIDAKSQMVLLAFVLVSTDN